MAAVCNNQELNLSAGGLGSGADLTEMWVEVSPVGQGFLIQNLNAAITSLPILGEGTGVKAFS